MSILALVSGSLFRSAESRVAKTGRQFIAVTIRVKDNDGSLFVRIVAFSETVQAELIRLQDGDALSVQGVLTTSVYTTGDGAAKVSLSLIADHVLPLRQPPRKRKPASRAADVPDTRARQERLAGKWAGPDDGPSDDIPFGNPP